MHIQLFRQQTLTTFFTTLGATTNKPLCHHLSVGGHFPLEPDVSLCERARTLDDPCEPSVSLADLQQTQLQLCKMSGDTMAVSVFHSPVTEEEEGLSLSALAPSSSTLSLSPCTVVLE